MDQIVRGQWPAMGTLFEMWLVGEDAEHLEAVGGAILAEVERIEKLLSRFDPSAEVARINREAASKAVVVDYELFAILKECQTREAETEGYFDICASSGGMGFGSMELDDGARKVRLAEGAALDLGAYGKGYALDRAVRILEEQGVRSALLHGGTSSVRAIGEREGGMPWVVGLRDPFAENGTAIDRVTLVNCGLSSSAVLGSGDEFSDIVDPVNSGEELEEQAGCVVLAPTAVEAEVYSTALLAMGKERALEYLAREADRLVEYAVGWLEQRDGTTVLEWLREKSDA